MAFTQGHTPAHKGRMTTTDPIRSLGDIQNVREVIGADVRLQALWSLAVNSALRVGDLCNLTWDDTADDGTTITLTVLEGKTKKRRVIPLAVTASALVREWRRCCDCEYIFSGQRGRLTTATWSRTVKDLCARAGLNGSFSGHSTRKTWARLQHEQFGTSMSTLMHALNHSNERQTLTYIGRLSDDLLEAYGNAL